jgi:hypothetical protein
VLQDDFYNHMVAAGYTDIQRGERGSTEEHLTVTQFKVEQEQKRLAALQAESHEKEMDILGLEELKAQAEGELQDATSLEVSAVQDRLNELTPRVKDAEAFIEKHLGKPEALLPEASVIERGTHYREEKAMPILKKLWKVALSLYHKLQELRRDFQALQRKFESVSHDRDIYKQRWEKARDENDGLKSELQDFDRVKRELGPTTVTGLIGRAVARERAERERKAAEKAAQKAAKRAARSTPGQDAR